MSSLPECNPESRRYPYTIRQASLADIDTLVGLRLALIRETDPDEEEPTPEVAAANRAYLEKEISDGDFVAWIAEMDGEAAGTIGLVFFNRPPHAGNLTGIEACILNMYTRAERRGMGIATALMEAALTYVRQSNARRIWLHATEAARPIYAGLGFSPNHSEMEINL